HAVDPILIVDGVVDFSYIVVADVVVGEGAEVASRGRRGTLEEAAGAGICSESCSPGGGAAQNFQADRTKTSRPVRTITYSREPGGVLPRSDGIGHAVHRIPDRGGLGDGHEDAIPGGGANAHHADQREEAV